MNHDDWASRLGIYCLMCSAATTGFPQTSDGDGLEEILVTARNDE